MIRADGPRLRPSRSGPSGMPTPSDVVAAVGNCVSIRCQDADLRRRLSGLCGDRPRYYLPGSGSSLQGAPTRSPGLHARAGWGALLLALLLGITIACGSPVPGTGAGPRGKVILTGSSTIAPLAAEIATRLEERNPAVRVDVQTGGSSRGIVDANSGVADLGMSSRTLKPGEGGLDSHILAYDGVAFVVHASNAVKALSNEQLRAIYSGRIHDWSEVGGSLGPITVVHRAAGRSEVDLVTDYLDVAPEGIEADLISGENQHALKTVAGDPAAIVYVSVGAAQRAAEQGLALRLLPLGGVPASVETVAAGEFPLARPLILLTQSGATLSPATQAFLDFALSAENHDLVESLAYVPPRR